MGVSGWNITNMFAFDRTHSGVEKPLEAGLGGPEEQESCQRRGSLGCPFHSPDSCGRRIPFVQ